MFCLLFVVLFGVSASFTRYTVNEFHEKCNSGNPRRLCRNVNLCWTELGFSTLEEMINLCSYQGYDFVVINDPPRNITIPEGTKATLGCAAHNTVQVKILKLEDVNDDSISKALKSAKPTTQSSYQEISSARHADEGWYACVAYGRKEKAVEIAYLEIRDICEVNSCVAPQQCAADMFTGGYVCQCETDCSDRATPVCASDCETYANECMMRKQTCERGLSGITVVNQGLCDFRPEYPQLNNRFDNEEFDEGAQIRLMADVRGMPEPEVKWYVDDREVGEGREFVSHMSAALRGSWRVEASNCLNKDKQEFNVNMRALVAQEPSNQCCTVYGDPHIVTFDGAEYDYMGSCTYTLAQEEKGLEWLVYGTFRPCGDKDKQVSCIISITVIYKNEMIQFLRMYRINYRGQEFTVGIGETRYAGEIKVENRGMKYHITLGDTGVVVSWDGIITSEICLPTKCARGVAGLCGNADCDISNEFEKRGTLNPYTQSYKAQTSSEFGNSWAVDPNGCLLEPEDAALSDARARPCSTLAREEEYNVRSRCEAVIQHAAFGTCTATTTINTEMLLANCMFDTCGGMEYGGDCGKYEGCDEITQGMIVAAIINGMPKIQARVKYEGAILDGACMMGLTLADQCTQWGLYVTPEWKRDLWCPSNEELKAMNMCRL